MDIFKKFESLIKENQGKYCKELDKAEEFKSFLIYQGLLFKIPEELFYLVQVYTLTSFSIVDEAGISRGINYEDFLLASNVSKTCAKKMMHNFQKNIASMSCYFIKKISQDLPAYSQYQEILMHLQRVDADMRNILPCYEVTKILLAHALSKGVAIVMVYEKFNISEKNENFLFIPNRYKTDFELCVDNYAVFLHQPCIVIQGISEETELFPSVSREFFIHQINTIGLKNIILANMAKHRQYPSQNNVIMDDNPYKQLEFKNLTENIFCYDQLNLLSEINQEFLIMRELAEDFGCCLENSKLFLIKHIYCDIIYNLIEQPIKRNWHEFNPSAILSQNNQPPYLNI